LQSLSDFRKKRQRIESGVIENLERDVKKNKGGNAGKGKLSFNMEDEEDDDSGDHKDDTEVDNFVKLGKDPSIDTSFLPDKGRDEYLEQEKRRLQLEWLRQQEEIKEAPMPIDYCFYDGTSHKKNYVH